MYDSLPNAALEALCCGLPVVITKDVGLFSRISKYNAGVICHKNKYSIAEALTNAWKKRNLFSRNALKASKVFDIQIKNQEWLNLYNTLLVKKKKRSLK